MASLRAIVLLLAVSAACAAKISGSVRATGVQRAVNEATRHIDSQIAEIENYGVITDWIDEALEKLKELVEKVKERVKNAETALLKAINRATETLADRLNKLIEKATGLDLHLKDMVVEFEGKTKNCNEELMAKVRSTLLNIKSDAETCAAPQIAQAKKLTIQIRELIQLLESVPVDTVKNIKNCINPQPITTTTPQPETTTPEPETTTAAEPETTTAAEPETTTAAEPETTTAAEPETTTAVEPETTTAAEPETTTAAEPETTTAAEPETTTAAEPETTTADDGETTTQSDVVVFDFNNHKRPVRGIKDIFEKIECVVKVLGQAAVDLEEAPRLVYYLDKEIRDLASKETQKTLKRCAIKAVSGRSKELQQDAAELAYCILAPSDDE